MLNTACLFVVLVFGTASCGPANVDEDGVANKVCTDSVAARAPGQALRSVVRDDGQDAWAVEVWLTSQPTELRTTGAPSSGTQPQTPGYDLRACAHSKPPVGSVLFHSK